MKRRISSKNYNKWKIIDVFVILAVCILSLLFTALNGTVEKELNYISTTKDGLFYVIVLVICALPTLLGSLALYFGIRYTIKKTEKNNLTYNASKDISYYRDVLNDLTPFEVSILANLNIEEKKDITATILWCQQKKYIDIQNQKIVFYDNIDITEKDKSFINFLKTNDKGYLEAYKNMVYDDLKAKKYIVENGYNLNPMKYVIKNIIIIVLLYLFIICLILFNVFVVKNVIIEDIVDLVIIIMVLVITYKRGKSLIIGYTNRKSKFCRTKLGEEKTTYIHALQNFIHDFSNLKDYDREQVVLWEDFLIYAIILEENDKIIEEVTSLFYNSNNHLISILGFCKKLFYK